MITATKKPIDHQKSLSEHTAEIFRPTVRFSYVEGHLFPALGNRGEYAR